MSQTAVSVTVKLFAIYQEIYGRSELKLTFPTQTPVKAVLEHLLQDYPQLEQWRNVTRFGINLQFVDPNTFLKDGDEVVLVPPVSGG